MFLLCVSRCGDVAHPPWGIRDWGYKRGGAKGQSRYRGQKHCSAPKTACGPVRRGSADGSSRAGSVEGGRGVWREGGAHSTVTQSS